MTFYKQLRLIDTDQKGFVYSPFSLSRVVSNYYEADHPLLDAYEELFGFTPNTTSESAWQMTSYQAMERDVPADADPDRVSTFLTADIYWVDEGVTYGQNFDRVHQLPFTADPERARQIINAWIEKRSGGLLADFLSEGDLAGADAVSTNVLFFKGPWSSRFVKGSDLSFQAPSGSKTVATFTSDDTTTVDTKVDGDVTVVSMPFTNGYRFVVLMPDDLAQFDATLDQARFEELLDVPSGSEFGVRMPTIDIKYTPPLVQAIQELNDANGYGYTGAEGGNFSGAYLESIIQKTVMEVDHTGAKAAAATVVIEIQNNAPGPPEKVIVDKPFVYLIQDGASGNVLFMGLFTGE